MGNDDVVLIPVFDDWASLAVVLPRIDETLAADSRTASVILVDDCSVQSPTRVVGSQPLKAIKSVDVLSLTRNIGHQRALAIGLSYIATQRPCRAVIVMDADGEDLPSDIPRLMAAFEANDASRVIFAQRTRRSEGVTFTVFYKLAVVSEMWNHYAAAVVHAKIPTFLVPTVRGERLAGRSRMDFVSLVSHGLSAMSVFSDKIAVRMLALTGTLLTVVVLAVLAMIGVRVFTDLNVPGWSAVALAFVGLLLVQAGLLAVVFAFMTQGGRARSSFIPALEYKPFVDKFYRIWPAPPQSARE